jgi:hypothetical protein
MVTLELPYHASYLDRPDPLPDDHLEDVRDIWMRSPDAYLAAVAAPALRMLAAACLHPQEPAGPAAPAA